MVFGISDDDQVVGLADAESDAERISEEIKTKLDPVPTVNLEFKEVDGKKLGFSMFTKDKKRHITISVISNVWHS